MKYEKYLTPKYLYLSAAVYCAILLIVYQVQLCYDSSSYISAWDVFLRGEIDKWRTPVYPFFLGILKTIFGEGHYLLVAVAIQHIVFLFSVRYLYLLLSSVICSRRVAFWLTAFYALYPCVQTYNCFIQTETFAISGIIFFLYSVIILSRTGKTFYIISSLSWLLLLVFHRPASIYLPPILFVGFGLFLLKRDVKHRKIAIYEMAGGLIVGVLLVVYSFNFKFCYGVFTPTGVGIINKYITARMAGAIDPTIICDPEMRNYMDRCFAEYERQGGTNVHKEVEEGINKFGMKPFSDFVNASVSINKDEYLKRLWWNFRRISDDDLFVTAFYDSAVTDITGLKIKVLYYLLIIYFVVISLWMKYRKEIAWFSVILFMIGFSNLFLVIIASPSEFGRLCLSALPVYIIMLGQLLDIITFMRDYKAGFL